MGQTSSPDTFLSFHTHASVFYFLKHKVVSYYGSLIYTKNIHFYSTAVMRTFVSSHTGSTHIFRPPISYERTNTWTFKLVYELSRDLTVAIATKTSPRAHKDNFHWPLQWHKWHQFCRQRIRTAITVATVWCQQFYLSSPVFSSTDRHYFHINTSINSSWWRALVNVVMNLRVP